MKIRFTEIPLQGCFVDGKGREKKKIAENRMVDVGESDGKVRYRKVKGNPEVEPMDACPLRLLGVGLRRHPERVIEIGDGNVLERRKKGR